MELKEGMEIAYNTSYNHHSGCFLKFSKVEKIFKNGSCRLEDGNKFGKNTNMIKTKTNQYPSGYLVDVESARNTILKENEIKSVRNIVANLEDAIKSKRATYHNIYFIEPEILEDMVALTAKLKEKKDE